MRVRLEDNANYLQLHHRLIPESPRWLLRKGRVLEAESILRHAARVNGVEKKLPPVLFDEQPLEESRGESVLVLRHHPRLMTKYLFIVYIWYVNVKLKSSSDTHTPSHTPPPPFPHTLTHSHSVVCLSLDKTDFPQPR